MMNNSCTMRLFVARWISRTNNVLFSSGQSRQTAVAVDKQALKNLRQATGYAIGNCRNALLDQDNNYDQALELLHRQAAKEGWAKATKLQGRKTAQGLVGTVIQGNLVLMLEVLCETDFVARNKRFAELISKISRAAVESISVEKQGIQTIDAQALNDKVLIDGEPVSQLVATEVGSIGENIQVSRAISLKVTDDSFISHYIHTAGMDGEHMNVDGCALGKYAAAVQLFCSNRDRSEADVREDGIILAQHVVGMAPTSIGEWESKPEKQSEDSEPVQPDEDKRLLYQEFLLDHSYSVKTWLEERNMRVLNFIRMGVGENNS